MNILNKQNLYLISSAVLYLNFTDALVVKTAAKTGVELLTLSPKYLTAKQTCISVKSILDCKDDLQIPFKYRAEIENCQ